MYFEVVSSFDAGNELIMVQCKQTETIDSIMDHISIPFSKLSVAPAAQASAQPVETIAPADLAPAAQASARKPPPVLAEDGTDITALGALICDGTDAQKLSAATALWNLAVNADNKIAIAKAKREAGI